MNSKKAKAFISNNLKVLFLSIAIGLFACAISIFAFSSPGSNQPPNGNPIFWLLSGTSMYYTAGNVGIGTNSPGEKLEVNGNIKLNVSGNKVFTWYTDSNQMGFMDVTDSRYPFKINAGAYDNALVIDNTGKVGIGMTNPSTTLQVNGTITANAIAGTTLPTRQIFMSGSGTYTTPAGVRQIRIRMVGGGGGGAGLVTASTLTAGSPGTATYFGTVYAAGGSGAPACSIGGTCGAGWASGGAGGTGGSGVASIRVAGQGGGVSSGVNGGGGGGNSFLGMGASGRAQYEDWGCNSPTTNSGGGGSGGTIRNNYDGGGGGGGEYAESIINSPGSSYSYSVGSGGAGGVSQQNGCAGGSGIIIVDESY